MDSVVWRARILRHGRSGERRVQVEETRRSGDVCRREEAKRALRDGGVLPPHP